MGSERICSRSSQVPLEHSCSEGNDSPQFFQDPYFLLLLVDLLVENIECTCIYRDYHFDMPINAK